MNTTGGPNGFLPACRKKLLLGLPPRFSTTFLNEGAATLIPVMLQRGHHMIGDFSNAHGDESPKSHQANDQEACTRSLICDSIAPLPQIVKPES